MCAEMLCTRMNRESGCVVADGFIAFELDLMGAVMNQLIPTLDATGSAPLTLDNAQALPDAQGVYLLIHDGEPLRRKDRR